MSVTQSLDVSRYGLVKAFQFLGARFNNRIRL